MGRLAAVTCSTCINLPLLYHRWHKFRVESSSSASWHCSVDNHRQLKHEISKEKKNQKQKQKKKKRKRRRRLCSSVIINKESDWHRWCKIWEISKSSIKSIDHRWSYLQFHFWIYSVVDYDELWPVPHVMKNLSTFDSLTYKELWWPSPCYGR